MRMSRLHARPVAMTSGFMWLSVALLLALPNTLALIIERPCCTRMTHVSGEFTGAETLEQSIVPATEIVPVSPFHACEPLSPASAHALQGNVALVQRGDCNFVKKVLHAQDAGAVGVVVMDSSRRLEAPYHIIMQRDENASLVEIPAVFVSYSDGERLMRLVSKAAPWNPVLVTLSDAGELPRDKTRFRFVKRAIAYIFLVSAVCALSSGLSIVSSYLFNLIGKTWRTRVTKKIPLMRYRSLLQQELLVHAMSDVHVLDRIEFDDEDEDESDVLDQTEGPIANTVGDGGVPSVEAESCSICLDDFAVGERVKVLPCQHLFHVECIDPWLERRSGRCPLCKQDAIAAADENPLTLFGYTLPHLDQILRQEHWFHTFFLMLPASLVSCLIVNTAASFIRNMWP